MDWIIHAVEQKENSPLKFPYLTDFHTHGLEKHGLKNLCMFFDYGDNGVTNAYVINTIAQMMINGEKFSIDKLHCIDDENGNVVCRFGLKELKWHNEDCLQIIVLDENYQIPEIDPSYSDERSFEEFDRVERVMRYKYQCMSRTVLDTLWTQ